MNAKKAGAVGEDLVAQYLVSKQCEILGRNQKIKNVEIDLLVRAPNQQIWLIEVKILGSGQFFERRVTLAQKVRIRRTLQYYLEKKIPARAHLALVVRGQVRLLADYFVRDL